MKFSWSNGSRMKEDAQSVGEQLLLLYEENGLITADLVKEAAEKKKNSPLGRCFEWDQKRAAEAWQKDQAYLLIRCICYTPENDAEKKHPIRAFFPVKVEYITETKEDVLGRVAVKVYKTTKDIMRDPDERRMLVTQALREAENWIRRYQHLKELESICTTLELAIRRKKAKKAFRHSGKGLYDGDDNRVSS